MKEERTYTSKTIQDTLKNLLGRSGVLSKEEVKSLWRNYYSVSELLALILKGMETERKENDRLEKEIKRLTLTSDSLRQTEFYTPPRNLIVTPKDKRLAMQAEYKKRMKEVRKEDSTL